MGWMVAALLALTAPEPRGMESVRVADDRRGFVLAPSGRAFIPWGLNYGNAGRLIEDLWESDWPTVETDFREMKKLGANVVRVHLQFGKFMEAADRPSPKALDRLGRLLALAKSTVLYLDLTGLACYRKADVPPWYDGLSEEDRWSAQACFWSAIAARCEPSPAVFCYDLMNEPFAGGGDKKPGDWYSGKPFGGYDFVQWVALDLRGRSRDEIAQLWIKRLTRAIRETDRRHPVTVGLLPWIPVWGHLSGFVPEKVAPELDFVSVHIYPEKGKVDDALATLKRFAVGKPVVVEETFMLSCSGAELEDFLVRSRQTACGWMGHYDGQSIRPARSAQEERDAHHLSGALPRVAGHVPQVEPEVGPASRAPVCPGGLSDRGSLGV
jgi:hypothetical protein